MSKVFASIGECMVELSAAGQGLYRRGFAGDTLNTAWYVRALTPPDVTVRYVSAVGTDALSDDMIGFMGAAGIDTSAIRRVRERTVGLYMITLSGHERSFTYWRDASAARLLAANAEALEQALDGVACAYFSGITLAILAPADREILFAALARVRTAGGIVAFDPNIRPRLWSDGATMRAGIEAGYRAATIALPTFSDESDLFADASPQHCAARVLGYGPSEVVVKDGPEPCLVATQGGTISVPATTVAAPVDTTGAGDSFNAGYLSARLAGRPAGTESAELAHAVASRVIGVRGALMDMRQLGHLRPD